jgi:hypothetical protein
MTMLLRVPLPRRVRDSAAAPTPTEVAHRREDDEAQRHFRELRSLLRRNQGMFAVEADWLSRHQADACGDTYVDLLLYQFLGHRSQRQRQRQAQLHSRLVQLNHIQFWLKRASTALDAGLLGLAERILRRTSHTLGVLLEDDVARLRSAPPRDPGSPKAESPSSTPSRTQPAECRSSAPSAASGRRRAHTSDGESL